MTDIILAIALLVLTLVYTAIILRWAARLMKQEFRLSDCIVIVIIEALFCGFAEKCIAIFINNSFTKFFLIIAVNFFISSIIINWIGKPGRLTTAMQINLIFNALYFGILVVIFGIFFLGHKFLFVA